MAPEGMPVGETDRDRYLARLESGWQPEPYVVAPLKAGGGVIALLVGCPVALALSAWALTAPDEMGYVDSAVASFAWPILLVAALTALAIWAWWKADLRTPLVAVAPLTAQAMGAALIIGFLGLGPAAFLAVLAFPVVMLGTISMLIVALRGLADRPRDGAAALTALVLECAAFGALTAGSPGTYISGGLGVVVAIAVIGGRVRGREGRPDRQGEDDPMNPADTHERVWHADDVEDQHPRGLSRILPARPAVPNRWLAGGVASALLLGGVAVGAGLFGALRLWSMPFYGGVGPGPGLFAVFLGLASAALGLLLIALWRAYFRPGVRAVGKAGAVCLCYVAVVAFLAWAPWTPPRTYLTPEIVGIVSVTVYDPAGVDHVKLEDGRTLDIQDRGQQTGQIGDAGRYAPLTGRTGIGVGELLLAGEHPTPWYTGAWAAGSSFSDNVCYSLHGTGSSRMDTVDFETGLRLRKAPDFERGSDAEYGFQGDVCVNRQGEVTEIHGGI